MYTLRSLRRRRRRAVFNAAIVVRNVAIAITVLFRGGRRRRFAGPWWQAQDAVEELKDGQGYRRGDQSRDGVGDKAGEAEVGDGEDEDWMDVSVDLGVRRIKEDGGLGLRDQDTRAHWLGRRYGVAHCCNNVNLPIIS